MIVQPVEIVLLGNLKMYLDVTNRPQYLSGLSRVLFPPTLLQIAVYTKPTRVSVSLCDPRMFHALCKFRHNNKPTLREAKN